MNIIQKGSPNYTKGRQGNKVTGIVCHWIVGNLASADATFQNRSRNTSAHYGIEDNTVHQYVDTDSTAYHAGNWNVNLTTVGIEHSAQPGRDASLATLDTSAQLIADLAKKYGFAINSTTVRPHRAIVATQCPGTINVEHLIQAANNLAGNVQVIAQPSIPSPAVSLETVTVAVEGLRVRSAPNTSAPLSGSMSLTKGSTFKIVGRVAGQNVSGISTWVKSQYGNFVWAGGLVGETSPVPARSSGTVQILANTLNVRAQPNTSSAVRGAFSKGSAQYVNVTQGQTISANGKTSNVWLQSLNGNWFSSVWTNYN